MVHLEDLVEKGVLSDFLHTPLEYEARALADNRQVERVFGGLRRKKG